MPTSDAQLRAVAKYDAENTVRVTFKVNRKTESDILEILQAQQNKQGFIKAAIREMQTQGPGNPARLVWFYGMRLRGFSPGCQPKDGLLGRIDSPDGRWHDIVCYDHRLTDREIRDFELEDLN